MKVKISTWTQRGLTTDDLQRWQSMSLIVLADGMIWTSKSPSRWPQAEKERYYETAGKAAKANGERRANWLAELKAQHAAIEEQYGKGTRTIHHTCRLDSYMTGIAYVTPHHQAFNLDGTAHYCERYLEPVPQSTEHEAKTGEYTYCTKCEKECGWTANTRYDELGFCPVCGMDCILPPHHPIRQPHLSTPNVPNGTPGPARLARMFPIGRQH
jgi:hypothetical protein